MAAVLDFQRDMAARKAGGIDHAGVDMGGSETDSLRSKGSVLKEGILAHSQSVAGASSVTSTRFSSHASDRFATQVLPMVSALIFSFSVSPLVLFAPTKVVSFDADGDIPFLLASPRASATGGSQASRSCCSPWLPR